MTIVRSPFVKVYLERKDDTPYDLSSFVQKFSCDRDSEKDDLVVITVKDELSLELLNNPILTMGAVIIYQYGFMSQFMSDIRRCVIDDIDPDYGEGDNVSLTFRCTDKGVYLKKSGEVKIWRNLTASQIARQIADKYHLVFRIEETTKVYKVLPQGNRPDFVFLKYLASLEGNGDYMAYVTGDELYFIKRKLSSASVVTFVRGDYEVYMFKPRWTEKGKDKAAAGVSALSVDPMTGAIKGFFDKPEKSDNLIGGNTSMYLINSEGYTTKITDSNKVGKKVNTDSKNVTDLPPKLKEKFKDVPEEALKSAGRNIVTPLTDAEELKNILKDASKKEKLKVLQAQLEVIGNPLIALNDVVTVSNVAKMHEGNWYVAGVEDTIQGSNYTTIIRLSKNALNTTATDNLLPDSKKGKENKTVGPDSKLSELPLNYVTIDKRGNFVK